MSALPRAAPTVSRDTSAAATSPGVAAPSGAGHRRLVELPPAECRRLLAEHCVGRLALVVRGQPVVLPVNYAFVDDRVIFRSGEGLKLHHTPMRQVAFEIDGIDELEKTGWSVLVQGFAYDVTTALDARSEALRRIPVAPFAGGERSHLIEIVASTISGRCLEGPPAAPGGPAGDGPASS